MRRPLLVLATAVAVLPAVSGSAAAAPKPQQVCYIPAVGAGSCTYTSTGHQTCTTLSMDGVLLPATTTCIKTR